MKKALLKSLMCFMLALSIIAGTVATAFADELIKNCYTADNAELLDEYINAYGWDKDKMLAKNWTDNGKEYKRQIGGQREYLADCFKGTDDFLMSEPEFDKDNKIILEGNKEKTIAFLEKHNIPLDSINSGTMVYGVYAVPPKGVVVLIRKLLYPMSAIPRPKTPVLAVWGNTSEHPA